MRKKVITAIAWLSLTAGLLGLAGVPAGAQASTAGTPSEAATAATAAPKPPKPPKGARAVVQVSPNPTTKRGQQVTITGTCGGGKGLKAVLAGLDKEHPVLQNIRIIKDNPKGFVAKATLAPTVGNGVGPVLVDCGGEAGVTLLVTHV
jgi:chemotaxis response regulator CheB